MINVLQIASGDLWAGAENMFFNLCVGLNKQKDINLYAIVLNEGELYERLKQEKINVTVIKESENSFLDIIRKVKAIAVSMKVDVIHTHRQKENVIGAVVKLFTGAKLCVRTVHGASEFRFYPWKIGMMVNGFLNWFCGYFIQDFIVSVSEPLRKQLARTYGRSKTLTICNGVNVNEIIEQKNNNGNELDGAVKIGMVGRLVPVKRFDLFLKVAENCKNSKLNVNFYILGDGPLMSEIIQSINKLKLHNVVLLGHVNNAPQIISQFDMIMMMSDHEGLPMTILESMVLQVPIVSHAVGEIPTILGDGKYGEIVGNQEPRSYCEIIKKFITKSEFFKHRAELAFTFSRENYSSLIMVKRYSELYAS